MDKQYCVKLVKLGNYFEWYEFELPVGVSSRSEMNYSYSVGEITEKTVYRAKKRIQEILLCNESLNKFITLTFRNIYDYETQLLKFKLFNEKLRKFVDYQYKYLAVPEYGAKNSRFHFHLVCNVPYIKKKILSLMWNEGFVSINYIDNPLQISSYLSKYLTKDFHRKLVNRKMYYTSRNLIQPVIYRDDDALTVFRNLDLKLHKKEQYLHAFLGVVQKLTYYQI